MPLLPLLPPSFSIERDTEEEIVVRWENPPTSATPIRAWELRELALALLEVASASDGARSPDPDAMH